MPRARRPSRSTKALVRLRSGDVGAGGATFPSDVADVGPLDCQHRPLAVQRYTSVPPIGSRCGWGSQDSVDIASGTEAMLMSARVSDGRTTWPVPASRGSRDTRRRAGSRWMRPGCRDRRTGSPEQDRVGGREDRDVDADAESKSGHGDQCEAGTAPELTQGTAHVTERLIEPLPAWRTPENSTWLPLLVHLSSSEPGRVRADHVIRRTSATSKPNCLRRYWDCPPRRTPSVTRGADVRGPKLLLKRLDRRRLLPLGRKRRVVSQGWVRNDRKVSG
jgi:hypothetical protein